MITRWHRYQNLAVFNNHLIASHAACFNTHTRGFNSTHTRGFRYSNWVTTAAVLTQQKDQRLIELAHLYNWTTDRRG